MENNKTITVHPSSVPTSNVRASDVHVHVDPAKSYSRAKIALAFGVAAVSDVFSIWITFAPPLQIALDMATALVLFWVFGRRWALLPGFIAEAIPGLGVFPVWVLVVLSIVLYDGFKKPRQQ